MARPKHPKQDLVVAHMAANADCSYKQCSVLFGVSIGQVSSWLQLARRQHGTLFVPPRPERAPVNSPGGFKKPNLVVLPTPPVAPPKALDPELTELARTASRNLLTHLADPKNLVGQPLRDVASTLKTLTDAYELLPTVDGKKSSSAPHTPQRFVDALLGKLPDDEDESTAADDGAEIPSSPTRREK
jgi:hypothetical protein